MNDVAANALIAAPLFVVGITLAVGCARQPARARRRGIRRLETYANHPGIRADIRDQIRKEDRP
jgi:hypothetical protein